MTSTPRRNPWLFLAIFSLGFCARIVYSALAVDVNARLQDDASQFDFIGWRLAQGMDYVAQDGYRTHRAPAQSLLLAGTYAVFGHDWSAGRVVMAGLGAATGVLVTDIGWLLFGMQVGVAAGLTWAMFPYSLFFCGTLLSEPLCALFGALSICSLIRLRQNPAWIAAWAAFSALCTLTRPNMGILFILGLGWVAYKFRPRWLGCALGVAVFAACVLPWTVRNYRVHGTFVPITTMGGVVLWEANNPYVLADPALIGRAAHAPDLPEARLADGLSEVEEDSLDFHLALDFIRSHPGALPRLVAQKLRNLFNPFPHTPSVAPQRIAIIFVPIMLFLLLAGMVAIMHRKDSHAIPVLLPIAAVLATAIVYWADARIRAPADPEIVLVCVYGAHFLLGRRWFHRP